VTVKKWLFAIAILGLLLRLIYRCGLCNPDSFAYIAGAADNTFIPTNIYENRIAITVPLVAAFKLFGFSEAVILGTPLVFSLATIIITYHLGYKLFDSDTGLLAALLVATIPQDVFYASSVLPDTVIPFYTGLTLLFFVMGQKRSSGLFYLLSGLALFCAFQARATSGIVIIPLFLVSVTKKDIRPVFLVTLSFLTTILIYWMVLFWLNDDFWLQLRLLIQDATIEKYVGTGQLFGHFKRIFTINGEFGLLYVMAFPVSIIALYRARGEDNYDQLPVITFLVLYLFFEFGTTTLTSYQPIWKLSRFLTILSVPASLVIASVFMPIFATSYRWLKLGVFGLLAMHILLAISLPVYNRQQTKFNLDYNYPYKAAFANLAHEDVKTIYVVNFRWSLRGRVYARLNERYYQYRETKNKVISDFNQGDVIIYDPIFFSPYGEYQLDKSDYPALKDIRANWRLLFMIDRPTAEKYPVSVFRVD
jgi:hypothetical protein